VVSKQSWFDAFERNLSESGWYDERDPRRADEKYERAGREAFDAILNRDAPERELEDEEDDDEHS
jgi:hypothetical protein